MRTCTLPKSFRQNRLFALEKLEKSLLSDHAAFHKNAIQEVG